MKIEIPPISEKAEVFVFDVSILLKNMVAIKLAKQWNILFPDSQKYGRFGIMLFENCM